MSKKIVAMLMAVAMAFSLLPVTAFATGGTQEGNSQPVTASDKNLTMNKTVKPNQDGTYTVCLESYATGSVTTTQAPVPMDFVLVLDVSGSMTDEIASYGYQPTKKTSWSARDIYYAHTTYYAKIGDEYYPVSYRESGKWYSKSYWLEANGQQLGDKGSWNAKVYNGPLYTYSEVPDTKTTKLAAMKTAVNNFIESVAAQKNGDDPVAHRISIVKFADNGEVVKELTNVADSAGLKSAVNILTANGATQADLGMQKAAEVLNGRQDKDRPSVVIMFTDGVPTTYSNFSWNVAGAAVDTAKTLKDKNTKVYTIGMFTDANPSDTRGAFNKYMNGVSSKYPGASGKKNSLGNYYYYTDIDLGGPADGNYYFKADNAGELDQVFQTISQSTTTTSPLDASAVVVDKVPSNFEAPISKDNVTLKVADYKADGTFGTETAAPSTIHASVNEDGTVSVTGFNFSENWCGLDGTTPNGKKLIIEFTIKCTNYGGTQPTNDGAYIKAKADDANPIIKLDYPTVPVKVKLPDGSDPYTDTKVYDGAGFDIKDKISKNIAGLVPVNGTKNQFIDLTYEIKDSSNKTVGTYTIPAGRIDGTWSDNTEIKTGPNVGEYKYTITVTGQDQNKEQPNNKASKTCKATFTIEKRDATFTGESKSVRWDGTEKKITSITPTGLLEGHTYSGLTYVAKGTNTGTYDGKFTGTALIKDAAGTDVTANYKVKTEPGKLTITNSTSEVTVTFKIDGGTWNGDTPTAEDKTVQVALTNGKGSLADVTIPTGSPSDGYTGDGVWTNDAGITGNPVNTTEITKDTVFTLTYSKIEPEVTNVNVTFKIVGGKWSDGTTNPITKSVQLTDGTGSLAYVTIPTGSPSDGYKGDGVWSNDAGITGDPVNTTEITKETTFTLTFPQKPAAPVEWDVSRSKTASGLTKNSNGEWTTDVTLTLPTVKQKETTGTEAQTDPTTTISKGSYVIDEIGDGFTLVGIGDSGLENGSFTMTVGGKEITGEVINGHTVNFGTKKDDGSYPYTVDYTVTSNTFTWNINKDVYAGTEVTLSYKLKLTNPQTGTYGVKDLDGDGKVDDTGADVDTTKALYTNKSAALYKDDKTKLAEFPKPSVSYTVSSGSSGSHSGGSRPSLNTKDHYGYIIGYPVDYYTGQPTTDQTKKPVRPEGKITRAEVATIYFRMLTDESRTKFWSQSNSYSDVKAGDWFNNAVSTLSNAGIIAGYEDGSFRPNGYITRAEFATIAARFFDVTYNGKDLFPDISGHWAKDYINQAANKGFVNGYEDGTFKPDRNITRAEAVTLVNRTLDRHPDKNHFTKDMLVWPDNMDQTKWYYADMQEATNSHTYQMKENSDKTKYENWTKTLPIRNWEALEKAWSNANSSQGNGNVV